MKNKIIIYVIVLITQSTLSQKINGICSDYQYFGEMISEIQIHFYGDYLKKIKRYEKFSQVKNTTPNDLITSQFSATNNKWISFNYNKNINWTKLQFDKLKNKENKIICVADFEFKVKDSIFNISRIDLFDESKRKIPICLLMKKENNKWFFVERNYVKNLSYIIMSLDIKLIEDLFINKKSENLIIQNLINEVYIDGLLNLSFLIKKLGGLLLNSKLASYDDRFITKEANMILPTNFNLPIFNQSFCKYFKSNNTDLIDSDLIELIGKNKNLTPILKYTYQDNRGYNKIFFKYFVIENKTKKYTTTMYKKDNVIKSEIPIEKYDEIILSLFKMISADVFIQFSNNNDDERYPEINILKPLVKDKDGVLNIYKFKDVVEKNKMSLSKYLNE